MENENEKSLSKSSVYLLIYRLLSVVFPLISSSYVSRVLLPTGVGKVSIAQNIVTYFTFLAVLGLPTYGTREIARVHTDTKKTNQLFTELITLNTISTTICAFSYYFMIFTVSLFHKSLLLNSVVGLSILFNYFNIDWFYQGIEEFRFIAIRGAIVKVLALISIFIFVRDRNDYIVYALISCFVLSGNYFLNIINVRKFVRLDFSKFQLKKHMKPLLVLFASNIAIELYTLVDTTMLGILANEDIVGYYTNSMKMVKIVITCLITIANVILPRLSRYYSQNKIYEFKQLTQKVFNILLFFCLPACIGLLLLANIIIPVMFGEAFRAAIPIFCLLCFLVIPVSLSTFIGTSILCGVGKEKNMLFAVSCGAISNIMMNAILIPFYQAQGAAIASVISENIVLLIELYYANKIVHFKIFNKDNLLIIIGCILMTFTVLTVECLKLPSVLTLLISVLAGTFVYSFTTILAKNSSALFLEKKVKDNLLEISRLFGGHNID